MTTTTANSTWEMVSDLMEDRRILKKRKGRDPREMGINVLVASARRDDMDELSSFVMGS